VLNCEAVVGRLLDAYKAAGGRSVETEAEGLELRLAELCARGRASHPTLFVTEESFAAHLGRCGAAVADGLAEVHAEDLFLAGACLAAVPGAVAELRKAYEPIIATYLKRVGGASSIREEVSQRLWDSLLVGGEDGPKLATYAGRGALGGWIGICAQRIALMMMRHEQAESRARNEAAARHRLIGADPEIAAIKERYREPFEAAVDAALATLDERDRALYLLHLVEGLTLERIGKVYSVSHTTVRRWLDDARERVLQVAKRHLRQSVAVSTAEFDSIARLFVSQLDLSITNVLSKGE
jgi:RNA polymerase sigma-70 factor (ECF subfamily)